MSTYRIVPDVDLSGFQGQRPLLEVSKDYVIAILEDKSFVVLAQAVRTKPKKAAPDTDSATPGGAALG